ncbi:hypothetical protein CapIbe_021603 [Capra ibex]
MVHLAGFLVSIAEPTTSTPVCEKRGGEHLEVIAAVALQADPVPQRRELRSSKLFPFAPVGRLGDWSEFCVWEPGLRTA